MYKMKGDCVRFLVEQTVGIYPNISAVNVFDAVIISYISLSIVVMKLYNSIYFTTKAADDIRLWMNRMWGIIWT